MKRRSRKDRIKEKWLESGGEKPVMEGAPDI